MGLEFSDEIVQRMIDDIRYDREEIFDQPEPVMDNYIDKLSIQSPVDEMQDRL